MNIEKSKKLANYLWSWNAVLLSTYSNIQALVLLCIVLLIVWIVIKGQYYQKNSKGDDFLQSLYTVNHVS